MIEVDLKVKIPRKIERTQTHDHRIDESCISSDLSTIESIRDRKFYGFESHSAFFRLLEPF